jgi:hypothetical protein
MVDWRTVVVDGQPLTVVHSTGVHRPSPFTRALAMALPPVDGRTAIDAGSGAGALTVALFRRGAARVIALDSDPVALGDTASNVRELLGERDLELVHGDFSDLADHPADILVTNPPQRPHAVWGKLEGPEQAVYAIGGEDGLDPLRAILSYARVPEAWTIISTLVTPDLTPLAAEAGYAAALVTEVPIEHDPVWAALGTIEGATARVWRLTELTPST